MLRFMPQHAARDMEAVLKSATANAENNHNLSVEDLVVVEVHANEAPTLKRWQPRAQGRAFPIHKGMTHITIRVADQEGQPWVARSIRTASASVSRAPGLRSGTRTRNTRTSSRRTSRSASSSSGA